MSIQVKICGIKNRQTLKAANALGVDYVGFVFFPASPRALSLDEAVALKQWLHPSTQLVALCVDAQDSFLDALITRLAPAYLQLHGHESVERVRSIKNHYAVRLIKAFGVASAQDLTPIKAYEDYIDWLLLDAKAPPTSLLPGGNGKSFDWTLLRHFHSTKPIMLSGGLNAQNLAPACALVHPAAVDVSSGVESQAGVKDKFLMEQFVAAVKALQPQREDPVL